jgi:hypothetical protein
MAKADRLERLDVRRAELEEEYTAALIDALRVTASGKWGLFAHNADRLSRKAVAPVIDNLAEIGQAIDEMREQLGMPPFELQQEFLASRGPVRPDAVGEPKQAQAWLDRLNGEERLSPQDMPPSNQTLRGLGWCVETGRWFTVVAVRWNAGGWDTAKLI